MRVILSMIPKTEKPKGETQGVEIATQTVLGCVYPEELKGITKIEMHPDGRHLIVKTATPIKGHKPERKIRIGEDFSKALFESYIKNLKTYAKSYITDKVKGLTDSTPTQLRHILATDQLTRTQSLKGVSNALGHKSQKNAMYYIDPLVMTEMLGEQQAVKMINKTEHGYTLGLMRLAVRLELKQFFNEMVL